MFLLKVAFHVSIQTSPNVYTWVSLKNAIFHCLLSLLNQDHLLNRSFSSCILVSFASIRIPFELSFINCSLMIVSQLFFFIRSDSLFLLCSFFVHLIRCLLIPPSFLLICSMSSRTLAFLFLFSSRIIFTFDNFFILFQLNLPNLPWFSLSIWFSFALISFNYLFSFFFSELGVLSICF